ncbi:hypothetical protein Fmac_027741 [Flemingia macrophylla]|uniref:PGG domain-containing protein n=1 Tax=Flemingia macrophylla TaxID=520843 RepID=A0ABD1LIL2_9FABA
MKMKASPTLEDDTITKLYEASLNGNVSALNTLIQRDPLILNRISLSPFSETPLHIASLLGHLQFCEVLLKSKPSLASEADSEGRFPLHLASAEGHTKVVKALLLINPDACFALDKDDMLPLHLASMRGRIGAIQELYRVMPESIHHIIDDGSILHLCVRYNHLEALDFLVQSPTVNQQFLLAKDKEGNTILHLAVTLKQIKTIKYLLMLPEMRTAVNALNKAGLTALEVLDRCPRDFISLKIQDMFNEDGVLQTHTSTSTTQQESARTQENSVSHESKRRKMWETQRCKYMQYHSNWIEEKRGSLMVVATVIATMTFQSVVSPPGGVWQEDTLTGGLNCTTYGICQAGNAVLAYVSPHAFLQFMTFNTLSFFCSLSVVLLLISGLRLNNRPMMGILLIIAFTALTSMGRIYFLAQRLVTPDHIAHRFLKVITPFSTTWMIMCIMVFLFHVCFT